MSHAITPRDRPQIPVFPPLPKEQEDIPSASPVAVTLFCETGSVFLDQLFCGFGALHTRRAIKVTLRCGTRRHPWLYSCELLRAWINGKAVVYDLADTQEIPVWAELEKVDFYFKRSYSPAAVHRAWPEHAERVFPLGLSIPVLSHHDFMWRRALLMRDARYLVSTCLRRNRLASRFVYKSIGAFGARQERVECLPSLNVREPTFVFFSRLWDPAKARSTRDRAERDELNAMKIGVVRAMRAAFGTSFRGGIQPSAHAIQACPDCIVTDLASCERPAHLALIRSSAVGIATTGLQNSIGWKLAEYVSAARAIVSEPLHNEIPGAFAAGRNLLEFHSPEGCVACCQQLRAEPDLIREMMLQNLRYYQDFMRPEALVLNSLARILAS